MAHTDKTRPYWVRLNDPTDPADLSHYTGVNLCGCRLCTDYYGRKEDRRKVRHNKRRDIEERNESN